VFIAYISLDEVNQDLAARTAEKYGAYLDGFASLADMPPLSCDVVIYDFDFLPSDERRRAFEELTSGRASGLTVVHSYNLNPREKKALRRHGVVVRRRLAPGWLGRLIHKKSVKAIQPLLAAG
jgi:hypothetical protein